MLHYPQINPIAFQIGPLAVHWYGLMYLLGFLLAWLLCHYRAHCRDDWTSEEVSDLIFYAAIGVILGGRLGYVLFYNLPFYFANPMAVLQVWRGGMSFHGGLIGVLLAMWFFAWRYQKRYFDVTDFIAPVVPLGLAAGRLGNFINGELWGKVSTASWAMVFPKGGVLPRHPSQLYELILEGLVLFTILWCYSSKPRPRMAVSGLFLFWYAVFRIFCEFFRQPDAQYGYFAFGWLTMGMVLSIPMLLLGVVLFILSRE